MEDQYHARRSVWRQRVPKVVERETDDPEELEMDRMQWQLMNGGGEDNKLEEYLDGMVEQMKALSLNIERPRKRNRGVSCLPRGKPNVGGYVHKVGGEESDNEREVGAWSRKKHEMKGRR